MTVVPVCQADRFEISKLLGGHVFLPYIEGLEDFDACVSRRSTMPVSAHCEHQRKFSFTGQNPQDQILCGCL